LALDDNQIAPLKHIVDFVHSVECKIGVQLGMLVENAKSRETHCGSSAMHWSDSYLYQRN